LLADPGGEALGAEFVELVARAGRYWRAGSASSRRDPSIADNSLRGLTPPARLHLGVAVDDHLRDVGQQPGRAVLPRRKLEQLRRLVEEPRRQLPFEELRVRQQVQEERDVGLHPADAELLQA